jgi:hypothetical protein
MYCHVIAGIDTLIRPQYAQVVGVEYLTCLDVA